MRDTSSQKSAQATSFPRTLGWFGIALGTAEILAPYWVARRVGLSPDTSSTIRWQGLREIISGALILKNPSSPIGMWARVAGDAIDLTLLARASDSHTGQNEKRRRSRLLVSTISALDVACAASLSRLKASHSARSTEFRESITIEKPPHELYRFWRSFDQLPVVMNYLESVTVLDDKHSHWVTKPLGDTRFEWDCEIVSDEPDRSISWRSTPDSEICTEGSVRFNPLDHQRGTRVSVEMNFIPTRVPPGLGRPLSKLAIYLAVRRDLRRFKQLMETGEIATVKGQPAGRSSGETWLDRLTSELP